MCKTLDAETEMTKYVLVPECKWETFPDNPKVSDYIFSQLMPLVNISKIEYMNFTSSQLCFENKSGNMVLAFLEPLEDNDNTQIEILTSLEVSIFDDNKNNIFELLAQSIKLKFGLVEV